MFDTNACPTSLTGLETTTHSLSLSLSPLHSGLSHSRNALLVDVVAVPVHCTCFPFVHSLFLLKRVTFYPDIHLRGCVGQLS